MRGQMDIFSNMKPDINEETAYKIIEPSLLHVLEQYSVDPKHLRLERKRSYSSVLFQSSLIARLCFRGANSYISFSSLYEQFLSQSRPHRDKQGFIRVYVESPSSRLSEYTSLFSDILTAILEHIQKEFDCCSRYMECSDAKKCIHPDRDFSLTCGYKKIMRSGKIFYGKNRNID